MAQGQVIEPQPEKMSQDLHDMYIKKQRTNEIAGWIYLGSGAGKVSVRNLNFEKTKYMSVAVTMDF